jgi:hypothetical protein
MRVIVEVREDAFRTPKTAQQIQEEILQGATMLGLALGDVTPEGAQGVATSPPRSESVEQGPMASELLLLGPNVGEDADFERPRRPARELPEWNT